MTRGRGGLNWILVLGIMEIMEWRWRIFLKDGMRLYYGGFIGDAVTGP